MRVILDETEINLILQLLEKTPVQGIDSMIKVVDLVSKLKRSLEAKLED